MRQPAEQTFTQYIYSCGIWVQIGWFYRWRGLPLWIVFIQDVLSVTLVFLAINAPQQGGLIALTLLLLAVRSSNELYRWYKQGKSKN